MIFDAQQNLVALLLADARPADVDPENWPPIFKVQQEGDRIVPVVSWEKGNLQILVQSTVQKLGIVAEVLVSDGRPVDIDNPDPSQVANLVILIDELVILNRARDGDGNLIGNAIGIRAEQVVERIIRLAHFAPNDIISGVATIPARFYVEKWFQIDPLPISGGGTLAYRININTQLEI